MSGVSLDQSIPISCALAALGGILEVFATAVLAYPAARSVEGHVWTDAQLKGCLAANIVFQVLASLAGNLFATWFGPVAIVGPIFFAAQLLANLVVFWIVLGLEAFSREMQIGTYVIVVAVVLLIINGPESQDYGHTTFKELITEFYAMIWSCILLGGMLFAGGVLTFVDLHKQNQVVKIVVLLVARATGFALNLSTGKAMIMPTNKFWLTTTIIVKVVSGIIYTRAIVVQSTAVEQRLFVPINAATIVFINALTGIIIWEDWRVIQSWVGYVCVFFLLALGCGLLLGDLGLLQETSPDVFRGAKFSMVRKETRREMIMKLKNFGKDDELGFMSQDFSTPSGFQSPPASRRHTLNAPSMPPRVAFDTPNNLRSFSDGAPIVGRRERPSLHSVRSPSMRYAWMSVYDAGKATPRTTDSFHIPRSPEHHHRSVRWESLRRQIEEECTPSDDFEDHSANNGVPGTDSSPEEPSPKIATMLMDDLERCAHTLDRLTENEEENDSSEKQVEQFVEEDKDVDGNAGNDDTNDEADREGGP